MYLVDTTANKNGSKNKRKKKQPHSQRYSFLSSVVKQPPYTLQNVQGNVIQRII